VTPRPRIVMHAEFGLTARRLAKLLDCAVTLSPNHSPHKITLYGFDDVLEEVLPVLRTEVPGWYVRTPQYGND